MIGSTIIRKISRRCCWSILDLLWAKFMFHLFNSAYKSGDKKIQFLGLGVDVSHIRAFQFQFRLLIWIEFWVFILCLEYYALFQSERAKRALWLFIENENDKIAFWAWRKTPPKYFLIFLCSHIKHYLCLVRFSHLHEITLQYTVQYIDEVYVQGW